MSEKEEENPFRKDGNPNGDFAILWDKIHKVDLKATSNSKDIEWLKKRFNLQLSVEIGIAVLSVIGVVIGLCIKMNIL